MWLCSDAQFGGGVEAHRHADERRRRRTHRRCSRRPCRTRAAARARSADSRAGPRSPRAAPRRHGARRAARSSRTRRPRHWPRPRSPRSRQRRRGSPRRREIDRTSCRGPPRGSVRISPASSRVRGSSSATTTCSWSACAPPPTAPRPSRVGTPSPAVKLPSLPPPTSADVSGGIPRSAATACARREERGRGRCAPAAAGSARRGPREPSPAHGTSMRGCRHPHVPAPPSSTPASRRARPPLAGTVLTVVPAESTVGVTLVPASASPSAAIAST